MPDSIMKIQSYKQTFYFFLYTNQLHCLWSYMFEKTLSLSSTRHTENALIVVMQNREKI